MDADKTNGLILLAIVGTWFITYATLKFEAFRVGLRHVVDLEEAWASSRGFEKAFKHERRERERIAEQLGHLVLAQHPVPDSGVPGVDSELPFTMPSNVIDLRRGQHG